MPVDLRIEGADDLERIGRQLRDLGDKQLRSELYRGMNRATKPLKAAARASALRNLPKRGGLNDWAASSRFSTSTRTGRDPSVRITAAKSGHDLAALERGRLRHPLFGDRRHWFTQQIRPGWFSEAMAREAPAVRREIVGVLDDIARKIG